MVSLSYGAQKTFTGTGNFSDATKWNGSSLPSAGDDLRIRGTCTFDNSALNLQYGQLVLGQGPTSGTLLWPVGGTNTLRVTNISGNLAGSSINMTNGGTLQFTGTWTSTFLSFVPGTGTIIVAGTATLPAAYPTYYNLSTSGAAGVATLGVATTVNNNLTVGANSTFNTGGMTLTVTGNVSIALASTMNAGASSITVKGNWSNSGTFNQGTSTVTFSGTGTQTVSTAGGTQVFNNLITANSGSGISFTSATTVNGTFSNSSGITNIGGVNFTVTGASTIAGTTNFTSVTGTKTFNDITVTGTWNSSVAEAFTINGSITNNGTFTSSTGIYTLAGTGKTLGGSNALAIANATVSGSYTNNGTFTVSTALAGTGALTQGTNSTLNIGGLSTISTLTATTNMPNTINYNGTIAQVIKCIAYSNLTVSGSNTKSLACATTVNGNMLISSGTLDATVTNYNIVLLGNWTNTGGTFTPRTATVTLSGTTTQIITKASGETFYNLTAAGAGSKLLGGPITVSNNLTISSTLDVSASNYQINLGRNWVNNGTFTQQLGTVNLNGTVAQTVGGSASTTFYNLTLNNTAGASITTAQNLRGTLTLTSGVFTTTGQTFTIISDATSTGRIGTITGGNITGNVTMQRYLPSGPTGWRMLACPLAGRTLSDWSDDFIMSGFTGSQYPTFSFNSVYTYDETKPGVQDTGFVGATNITNAITVSKGYFVYLGPVPLTIDVTGAPNKFNQNFSITYTNNSTASNIGWNLITNPYPSSVDWNSAGWTKTNLNNAIYVWNPTLQQFSSYVGGFGTNGGSNIIPSSQAFWVQANAASPGLLLTESAKSATDQAFFRMPSAQAGQYAFKLKVEGNNFSDETVISFDPAATGGYDPSFDALKMASWNTAVPSISTVDDTLDYAVNSLPALSNDISIPVRVKVGTTGTYVISDSILGIPLSSCIVLEDMLTGISTDLRAGSYTFTIADTTQAPRFIIHIGAPFDRSSIAASCSNDSDGVAVATGKGTGPWDYEWKDASGTIVQNDLAVTGPDSLMNAAPGVYTLTITNNSGLCGSLSDTVIVGSPVPLTFSATATSESCLGNSDGSVMLNAVNGGTSPFNYSWSNGMSTANLSGLLPGTYTLTITDDNGCTRTDSVMILQGADVVSAFTSSADTAYIVFGGNVSFTNSSSGAASYEWNYGDSSSPDTLTDGFHSYSSTGVYSVMLVSMNGSCSDTSYSQVVVLYDPLSVNEAMQDISLQLIYNSDDVYLSLDLDAASDVRIEIFNTLGQQVQAMKLDGMQHSMVSLNNMHSNAIYFVRVQAGERSLTRKFYKH
jgi:hypothetical protein